MPAKLKGRSFINTLEYKPAELEFLLERGARLKKSRGKRGARPLEGKAVALVFFNPSLRTRVSFQIGIQQLGGHVVSLSVGSESWTLEHREGAVMDQDKTEHIKDAARVLSRYVDAICVRSFPGMKSREEDMADSVIESFRKHATVPVINMESALWHPCQAMADAMTIREKLGKLKGARVTLTWAYHPKALPMAVGNSFAAIVSQLGADLTIAHPPEFALEEKFLQSLPRKPRIVHTKEEGLREAQIVYAKSWGGASFYGRWEEEKKIREGLRSWICDRIPKGAHFLHCLPVRRNVEVADAVLDESAIYDEAENRLHVQKAILSELVG
ncbi:MAG TPA: N-acetylornithine carbamoyltransferase [Planctomycetota bacterium]|nr:N-acetylornithine carbamoyltransferase [Planctomycetota bacterium]